MGSQLTHVANSYNKEILARVDTERQSLKGAEVGVQGAISMRTKLDVNKIEAGFTKIKPNKYVRFEPDCSGASRVYITIVDKDGEVLCDNLPKRINRSVIVSQDGQVVDTKMGTIWTED